MNLRLFFPLGLLCILLFPACSLLEDNSHYQATTAQFVDQLIDENYSGCFKLIATEHEMSRRIGPKKMKKGLENFRSVLIENFGRDLEYSFMAADSDAPGGPDEDNANITRVLIEFNNGTYLGVFQVGFDDYSHKILNIKTLDVQMPIPSMSSIWVFGLLALVVLLFNIYMLIQVKKSGLNKKWIAYLSIIIVNVPSLTYKAVDGFFLEITNIQYFLGVGFANFGYFGTVVNVGIPVAAIYWYYKLKRDKTGS